MTGSKKDRFRYMMFIIEGVLLLGALVLLVLSGPPQAIGDHPVDLQGLENTPEPKQRDVSALSEGSAGAVIVLDASGIDDGGYFKELVDIINGESGQKGQYIKSKPENLLEDYEALVAQGTKPTIVMGLDALVAGIKGLADISGVYGQLYFNEAADRCVTKSTLPLALCMYAYYFRMDIMHDMRVYVPRSYAQISEASALIAAKDAQRKAFALEPGAAGSQLMLQQMVRPKGSDIYDFIDMLSQMRAQGLLLEDMEGGSAVFQALCEGSAVMAFSSGELYAALLSDKDILELVQVKPYLGNEASYTASVVSCAIVSGEGFVTAQRYLVKLFREGIDEIIMQRNPQMVNPGMEYALDSPWAGVLTDGGGLIVLNENMMYRQALIKAFGYKDNSMGEAR